MSTLHTTFCGSYQKLLLEKLFAEYDSMERPVEEDTQSLDVTVGLALQQIVDVVSQKINIKIF